MAGKPGEDVAPMSDEWKADLLILAHMEAEEAKREEEAQDNGDDGDEDIEPQSGWESF